MNMNIPINGEQYPCSPSMGAMLRFKKETGKEVTEIDSGSVSELCVYLYCCVASACHREGKEFNLSLMDFADRVTPEDMAGWQRLIMAPVADEDEVEKKSQPASASS